jgi:hypothetical protein
VVWGELGLQVASQIYIEVGELGQYLLMGFFWPFIYPNAGYANDEFGDPLGIGDGEMRNVLSLVSPDGDEF